MKATSFLVAGVLVAAFVAACGGAQPGPEQPPSGQTPEGPPTPSASADAAAPVPPGSSAPPVGSSAPVGPSGPGVSPMKGIEASAMATELQNLGLDLKNLPPLEKLEPAKLRKVMRTFTKSLGIKCSDCHNESDYAVMTPMKKVTMHMWNDFVRGLALENGTALYCDSCHQGRAKYLDRHDKKALGAWMDQNFVAKVKRRDGKEHTCATCHGDPFEPSILARWAK